MRTVTSLTWAASKVVLSTPGKVFNLACTMAAPGTYYLIVLDAATVPADGSDITLGAFGKVLRSIVITTSGANEIENIGFETPGSPTDNGIQCGVGCVVLLSSTAETSVTGVPAGLRVNADVG